jgi:predicted DNA-binding WGR domain protein
MEYKFIGWCREGTSDKVWGVIPLNAEPYVYVASYVVFWGRRGKKLQTKILKDSAWGMGNKIDSKKERGYVEVDLSKLNELYPEFESDLSKTAMWAMLKV